MMMNKTIEEQKYQLIVQQKMDENQQTKINKNKK